MSAQRTWRSGRIRVSQDGLSFLGGWGLMIYEAMRPPATFNLAVFLGGMAIAGIPGAVQALMLWLGSRTVSLSPPSPEPASSPDSSG